MYKEQTDRFLALEEQLRQRDETEAWLRQAFARAEETLLLMNVKYRFSPLNSINSDG